MTLNTDPIYRLHCSEIWGGNQDVDCDVCTSGITASIYSSAYEGSQGGDIYYFTVCSSDLLTRMILADLRGHGPQVSQLSAWIYEALRKSMQTLDGDSVLKSLNQTLCEYGNQSVSIEVISFPDQKQRIEAVFPPVVIDRNIRVERKRAHSRLWIRR